jgi:hypothetical protein
MVERRRSARSPENIPFTDAVGEAKLILKQASLGSFRLGELADRIEPVYGEGTLARFAREIGIAACTLDRHRSVFRAWKNQAPGPELSYAVLRELAAHPKRAEIIRDNPAITKREAAQLMGASRKLGHETAPTRNNAGNDTECLETNEREQKKWRPHSGSLMVHANKAIGEAKSLLDLWCVAAADNKIDIDSTTLTAVEEVAEAWSRLADYLSQFCGEPRLDRRAKSEHAQAELAVQQAH